MVKSTTGLKKETAAALSYVLGPLTGIIFIILEKDEFVRFHAMQSVVVLGTIAVLAFVTSFIPPLSSLLWLAYFLVLMAGAYNASQGNKWEVPVIMQILNSFKKK